MKNKLPILFILFIFTSVFSFAGDNSFIRIVYPDDEDNQYVYNTDNLYSTRYTFNGSVSSDCMQIRCLWVKGDKSKLIEYIVNGYRPLSDTVIDDFTLKQYQPGNVSFEYNVSESLDNLAFGSNHYMFIAKFRDGTYKVATLTFYVHSGGYAERAKPVIYLYPKKKQNIKVSVNPAGGLLESIPEMGKKWNVTAYPDGKIYDKKTKKDYPYLYWESVDSNIQIDTSKGFVVESSTLEVFFVEKLTILGLNEKEIADFNEYWVPELTKYGKPYIFITFYLQERIDAEAPLKISPKPESVIRVYFDHKPLDTPIDCEEQVLKPAERSGFAVVEWGGRRYR
ncbi:MAG: hypothetical protein K6E51_13360 [Treponema sp.]|nr:hypothetical protein [Treponema sp.]